MCNELRSCGSTDSKLRGERSSSEYPASPAASPPGSRDAARPVNSATTLCRTTTSAPPPPALPAAPFRLQVRPDRFGPGASGEGAGTRPAPPVPGPLSVSAGYHWDCVPGSRLVVARRLILTSSYLHMTLRRHQGQHRLSNLGRLSSCDPVDAVSGWATGDTERQAPSTVGGTSADF